MKHCKIKVIASLIMVLGVLSCQTIYAETIQEVFYSNSFDSSESAEELIYNSTGSTSYTVEELDGESYLLLDDQDKSVSLVAAKEFSPVEEENLTIGFRFKQPNNLGYSSNSYGNIIISQQGAFLDKNQVQYHEDILVSLYIVNGNLRYKDLNLSGSTQKINGTFTANDWHDLEVKVDFEQRQWSLWLDGTSLITREMKATINQIDAITFKTSGKRYNTLYLDNLNLSVEITDEEEEEPPANPIFQQMRQNYVDYMTGKNGVMTEEDYQDANVVAYLNSMDSKVGELLNAMDLSSNRTYIWPDLDRIINNGEVWPKGASDKRSDDTKCTFGRLEEIAIAYETEGSQYFHSDEVKEAVIGALEWLYDNDWYSDGNNVQTGGNWWDWAIGSPNRCLTALIVFYDDIDSDLIQDYVRTINVFKQDTLTRTSGANLMWQMNKFALCEMIEEDDSQLQWILSHLSEIFTYVVDGDGFYEDGSYIQHKNVANTGNYGRQLIQYTARVLSYTKDTPWAISVENYGANANNLYEVIGQNFQPFMYEGVLMSMVNGRHIASPAKKDYDRGYTVMQAILGFIDAAPDSYKDEFKSMLKYWIETDDQRDGHNFYSQISPYSIFTINEILNDSSIESRGPLKGIYNAAGMDRIVQRKEDYAFGIAMASDRVVNGENNNKENIRGWHLGSGATYLYNADDNKYSREYWPLVDAFRIPGITAMYNEKFGMYNPSNPYAGGAVLADGSEGYGTAGMILDFNNSKISGKKSWFMFDDEVVAMGSDIRVNSPESRTIETTIENYHIKSDASNTVTVDGEEVLTVNDVESVSVADNDHTVLANFSKSNVSWINYEGNVADSSVGFYFPSTMSLEMMKDKRSYSYFTINQNIGSNEQHIGSFLTIYKDHGNNPSGGSYVYTVLPNKSSQETEEYAINPDIEVIAHTDKAHGVRELNTGITAVNFFANENLVAGPISANKKCSVIMEEKDGVLTVSVSDPTQKNNGYIDVYLDRVGEVINSDSRITVLDDSEGIHIRVNTANGRGRSFTATFTIDQ